METPKFQPETWVLFKLNEGTAFGKILGGLRMTDQGWLYQISNAASSGMVYQVWEPDIIKSIG